MRGQRGERVRPEHPFPSTGLGQASVFRHSRAVWTDRRGRAQSAEFSGRERGGGRASRQWSALFRRVIMQHAHVRGATCPLSPAPGLQEELQTNNTETAARAPLLGTAF